jgi:hypothetical protein
MLSDWLAHVTMANHVDSPYLQWNTLTNQAVNDVISRLTDHSAASPSDATVRSVFNPNLDDGAVLPQLDVVQQSTKQYVWGRYCSLVPFWHTVS